MEEIPVQALKEEIRKLVADEISRKFTVFEGEFINVTPWWGHGPLGKVIDCDSGNYSLPTSNTIIGKTRWVLSLITAKYAGRISFKNTYNFIDSFLGRIGSASLYTVLVNSDITDEALKSGNHLYYTLESLRKEQLLEGETSIPQIINKCERKKVESPLCQLLLIPRFSLSALGIKQEREGERKEDMLKALFEIQPLKPMSVKVHVKILRKRKVKDADLFDKILVISLVEALQLFGIGSATNRGFGRFVITEFTGRAIDRELEKKLNALRSNSLDAHKEIMNLALRYAENLATMPGDKSQTYSDNIPSIETVLNSLENPGKYYLPVIKHPYRQKPVSTPEEVLSAIGYATLKKIWKRNISETGFRYHTWPLGFPRGKKKRTGYFLARECSRYILNVGREAITQCIDADEGQNFTILRRQSMIVLSPLFSIDNRHPRFEGLVIIDVRAGDLDKYLHYEKECLVHVGEGTNRSRFHRRNKLHVIPIALGIQHRIIKGKHEKRWCGKDAGRVRSPRPPTSKNITIESGKNLRNVIVDIAIDWLKHVLTR